jgi:protein involved in polysaccharide export with SLBB domain
MPRALCPRRSLAALVVGWLTLAGTLAAQPASAVTGSKYYVWGQVRSPGAYNFVAAPDIPELISAAGGPTDYANLKRVVLIQAVSQKKTRIDVQAMLVSGHLTRLAPGDVVIVPSSSWHYFTETLTVLTSVVSLATLVITVLNWMKP